MTLVDKCRKCGNKNPELLKIESKYLGAGKTSRHTDSYEFVGVKCVCCGHVNRDTDD